MDDVSDLMSKTVSHSLMRLIGLNKWALDLQDNILHIEYGRKFEKGENLAIPLTKLQRLYTPDEMAVVAAHWREAAAKGFSGPVILPFVRKDGSKAQIESVGSLEVHNGRKYLVGMYKTIEDLLKAQKRARLLKEFLDAFVQNSPSAIIVFDHRDRVLSANESLGKFLNLTSVRPLVGHTIDHMERMIEPKFMSIIKASLKLPTPSKGRHIMPVDTGLHQSVYWRCFPLSMEKEEAPPKVFCFDLHAAGPTTLVA
jgi:PAS domain-containing protein